MNLREIDFLIATKVLDYQRVQAGFAKKNELVFRDDIYPGLKDIPRLPHFTTDMTAAWSLLETLEAQRFVLSIDSAFDVEKSAVVRQVRITRMPDVDVICPVHETAKTPLSISLATLKAKGVQIPD